MKKKHKELFALMSAQHDGIFDEAAGRRLAELLEGDEEAQCYYLELGNLFHELEETYHGNQADAVVLEFPVRRTKIIQMVSLAASAAAVASVAFFLLLPGTERSGLLVDKESTVLMNDEHSFVARVVDSSGVKWGAANTAEIRDGILSPGMLELEAGSLDVVLDNGVRFGFVAPVQMDLASLQRLSLKSGAMVMDVPGLSEGLAVNTPDAVIKAHTANARIQCVVGKETLVNVERGAVSLFTENKNGREIRKSIVGNESVEIARGKPEPIVETKRVVEPGIDLSLPPELNNLQYVHYRFDESRTDKVKNHGTIQNADGWLAGIAAHPEYPEPRRIPGRFKRGLEFSGHGEGVLADLKDFGSDEPGSVAFWIKMDPDTVPGEYENIFTWHMYRYPEKGWHDDDEKELACRIRVNHLATEGVVGAVRIEFRNKWITGTTDLRDGRWHHVTAVFHRRQYGVIPRHYIDGELARSSARGNTWFPKERYDEVGGGSIAVGRVYWPERPNILEPTDPCGLRGSIDELYVFNQPVLPSHAASLHMKNSPGEITEVSYIPALPKTIGMMPGLRAD